MCECAKFGCDGMCFDALCSTYSICGVSFAILDKHNTCASQQCVLAGWIGRPSVKMETSILATCHSESAHSGLTHTCGKRCDTTNCD